VSRELNAKFELGRVELDVALWVTRELASASAQTPIKLVDCSHYQLFHLAHNIITNPTLERRLYDQITYIAIFRGLALENEDPA
jgi:hypothetical protein